MPDPDAPLPADADDSLAGLTLPWHHLSALTCLTRGFSVPNDAEVTPPVNLFERLLSLPPDELIKACAPNQTTSKVGGLYWHVQHIAQPTEQELATDPGKETYDWRSATGFKVKLRTGLNAPFLSPAGIVLPWPLPADKTPSLANEVAEKYAKAGGVTELWDELAAPTSGLYYRRFMNAVDDAIDPDSPYRDDFKEHADEGHALAWLLERSRVPPAPAPPPPTGMTVALNTTIPTSATQWTVVGSGSSASLHLELGWKPPVKNFGDIRIMVDAWPCGAFKGYTYPGEP